MSNSKINFKSLEEVKKSINSKSLKVCVIGIGRIGLPTALSFAKSGLQTIGVDINETRLSSIKNGVCPFYDPALQENLNESKKLGMLEVVNDLEKVKDEIDPIAKVELNPKFEGRQMIMVLAPR